MFPGQLVSPGTEVIALVEGGLWVQANFEETQLGGLHPGDAADIKVHAVPGRVFSRGVRIAGEHKPTEAYIRASGVPYTFLRNVILLEKTHRFSELARRIGGVSERMLAHSLQALESDGFVSRTVYPTKPPKVEYSLTPLGRELAAHVQILTRWVEENVERVLIHRRTSAQRKHLVLS